MDSRIVYIISIAVTFVGLLASTVYGDDADNERLRQRRQTGAGGAYSSSGTFAWWKIVLVVAGGLAGMEILYCCCKNYLRKQGSTDNEKSNVHKANSNRSESSVTLNDNTVNHMRKNNSFVEAMKPQGYSTLREQKSPTADFYYYPPPTSPGIVPSSYPQKSTFYVEQPPVGYNNIQYTHHLIPVPERQATQWGNKMHPLLGASTFV